MGTNVFSGKPGNLFRIFGLFLFLLVLPTIASAAWTVEAVDAPKYFTNFYQRAIAIDRVTNQPHIVYGGDHLYHAYYDGVQWQYETIDTSPGVGQYVSIAIDLNNKIHISYYDSVNYDLKYATNTSGSWGTSTIDSAGDIGQYSSIAIDSNSNVHISYHDYTNKDLKYATNASGSWLTSTIDSTGYTGEYTSIAVDSNNKIHISYYSSSGLSLNYATNQSGAWIVYVVDSVSYHLKGQFSSIAIDSNNKVHISYYEGSSADLRYATNASGAWTKSNIDTGGQVGVFTSISIDINNKVHICYLNLDYDTLKYATNASGAWAKYTIDTSGSVGSNSSITLDANNKVHISYLDEQKAPVLSTAKGSLKYATNASGLWVNSIIDLSSSGTVAGDYSSISVDLNNNVHISYSVTGGLYYTTKVSGLWVKSLIDSYGAGKHNSIAIDSNTKLHIAYYYENSSNDLKYATNASGSWVTSTIDSSGTVGQYSSIAIDSNNKAHISYYGSGLKYATNASGSWVTSTIDSTGYTGGYTSIAVDSDNKVHISYYDYTNKDLKYATNASGSWVTSTIDSTGYTGGYTSIAVDSDNKVHISYYDYTNKDLKYATNASGSWVTSTIDSTGDVGGYTSIAIDSGDKVRISYFDASNQDLKYAVNTIIWYIDSDSDGYGDPLSPSIEGDVQPPGYVSNQGDCNDTDPTINPAAPEICDGIDNNCNGQADEGFLLNTYYPDTDGDGYGNPSMTIHTCVPPPGYVDDNSDCNDNNISINPTASEVCDFTDNNCDGQIDESLPVNIYYRDADGDGYGDPANSIQKCDQPSGYVTNNLDCNDSNAAVYPGAIEVCDLIDDNCDGQIDEGFADNDADGYIVCLDCDDNDPEVHPGGTEVPLNGKDDDCDSLTPDNWRNEALLDTVYESSIATDSVNKVHISYYDSTDKDLRYLTNASGVWVTTTIDSAGDVGAYPSIAIDSNNRVHISYYDVTNKDLKYATNTSGSWITSTIDSTGDVGRDSSIAIDSNNKVHISYYYISGQDLRYATNASGSWITSTIDSTGDVGFDTSIAVDSNDKIHISYEYFDPVDFYGHYLKYATNASGTWVISTLRSDAILGYVHIALDSNNKVHISFFDMGIYPRLLYITNASGFWITSIIDDAENFIYVGYYNSIALDSNNNVHISYYDDTNGDLKYATNESGSWIKYRIDTAGDVGLYTSIAVDSNNKLHISYYDNTNGKLKYATNTPVNLPDTDDDGDGYTENQGDCNDNDPLEHPDQTWYLDADNDGYSDGTTDTSSCTRPIGYKVSSELTDISGDCNDGNAAVNPGAAETLYNGEDDDCNVNTPDYQWYTETAASNSGSSGIIGIDPNENIHIYYCAGGQTMHAIKDISGSWSTGLVANVCGNMAIDLSGNVHISHYEDGEGLIYGTNKTGTWISEVVDINGKSGPIAVDSEGEIHIVYALNGDPNDSIKYVTNTSGSWITETPFTETCYNNYCDSVINLQPGAIKVDSSGKAHIAFIRSEVGFITTEPSDLSVKYLTNQSGTWVTESVGGVSGNYCIYGNADIASDSSGKAHVSYSYSYSYDWMCTPETFSYITKYATNSSGSWMSTTLDNTCSGKNSMAVDPLDNTHVFYCGGYATNETGEWISQSVNGTSIAIDSSGYVHTNYVSVINGPLYYVTNNPGTLVDNDGDGYTIGQGDCDDNDPLEHPDQTWYLDADNDGYSDGTTNISSCTRPIGYKVSSELTDISGDCNDGNSVLNPSTLWYPDLDSDGFGNPSVSLQQCVQPQGYILNNTDCDDYDADIYPGGPPIRITDVTPLYFLSLQGAYGEALGGDVIEGKAVTLSENLNFNQDISVFLDGGYNCGYSTVTGKTVINGSVTVSNGTVTIGNVELQ